MGWEDSIQVKLIHISQAQAPVKSSSLLFCEELYRTSRGRPTQMGTARNAGMLWGKDRRKLV